VAELLSGESRIADKLRMQCVCEQAILPIAYAERSPTARLIAMTA
jgi:hypothetical protein